LYSKANLVTASRRRVRPAAAERPALFPSLHVLNRLSPRAPLQRSLDRADLIEPAPHVIDLPRTITRNSVIHNKLFIVQILESNAALWRSLLTGSRTALIRPDSAAFVPDRRVLYAPKALIRMNFSQKSIAFHS
jgi:hypothetical protein